jgi:hypothetical protein
MRVGSEKAPTNLRLRWGTRNLDVMADLSNPSHMMAYEDFHTEYSKEFHLAVENLLLSYFRQTNQGVIKIKEVQQPPTI